LFFENHGSVQNTEENAEAFEGYHVSGLGQRDGGTVKNGLEEKKDAGDQPLDRHPSIGLQPDNPQNKQQQKKKGIENGKEGKGKKKHRRM
jgi:hypothetical protein